MVGPAQTGCPGVSLGLAGRAVRWRVAAAAVALAGVAAPAPAQEQPLEGSREPRLLSDAARVSLITIMPGERVYSVFGHNALRVVDPDRGIDSTYNFGTFDFGNPFLFTATFLYGALDYRLSKGSYDRMVAYYPSREGRPIIEQWLDLDAEQREALYRFLEWNALPANAYYRYDFYYDNCATRIRDLLEQVVETRAPSTVLQPERTMRQLLDPYLVERPWLHLGMDFGQGVPADRPATLRDAMFLPDELAAWVAELTVPEPTGDRPLVAATDSIGWASARPDLDPALPWPELLLGGLLLLVVVVTALDGRSGRPRRWLDVPLFGLVGVAGLGIAFLWFVSLHPVTKWNVHLLWALPTHLAVAWQVARGVAAGPRTRAYLGVAAVLAATFVVGLPFWRQEVPVSLALLAIAAGVRSAGLAVARPRSV